jgi:AbrB family looped-hinge helix DNA binding protein
MRPLETDVSEALTVVTRKGQITVPAAIRRALRLEEGDKVALALDPSDRSRATLRPVRSVADATFGAVQPLSRPEDFKRLRRAFEEEQAVQAHCEGRAGGRE